MAQRLRHPKTLQGDEALDATVDHILKGLVTGSALRSYVQTELGPCKTELRNFLSEAFEGIFPGIRVGRDLLSEEAISGFEKVLLTAIEENDFRAETALEEAIRLVPSQFNSDARVLVLLAELEDAVCTSSVMGELESPDDAEEPVQFSTVVSFEAERHDVDPEDVFSDRLEPLVLYQSQVMEVQECWKRFLSNYERPEEAGEAIFASIVDSAPSLQSLFKGQKFIAGKFINRFHEMVMNLQSPTALISLVEQTGFQHLLIDISVPRIAVFREALIEAISNETPDVTPLATSGLQRLMSYAGGSFIYIRENFAKRLGLISDSWKKVALKQEEPEEQEQEHDAENAPEDDEDDWEEEDKLAKGASDTSIGARGCWARLCASKQISHIVKKEEQRLKEIEEGYQAIPRNFESMFRFNAAVMGISGQEWMYEVLDSFDTMVRCISQSVRLQVECDVVSLRIAIVGGEVKFSNFKAVMLSTLRSLLPEEWGPEYEEAWNWLWSMVERLLRKELKKPRARERLLGRFLGSMEEELADKIREQVYDRFFELAPAGQEYFIQSATRLNFIADRAMELAHALYKDPRGTVDEIAALGLRHVGYAVPVELFEPFVEGWRQVLLELTGDENLVDAFHWPLRLTAQLLVRTIQQGATLVMLAINTNSGTQMRKALSYAPRKKRALWILDVTVGSQSVSPLLVSIESGNLEAAKAMLEDLMTIRADRARYYYGVDELFKRHPDMVEILTQIAPELLTTMLDGMVWRSRTTVEGMRRVNYYLKHLLVDQEGHFSTAMSSVVKLGDPEIAVHPVMITCCDLLWNNLVHWRFLRSKVQLLFTTTVFLLGQSVLHHLDDSSDVNRIATFTCRTIIYLYFMVGLIYARTKVVYQAIKQGDLGTIAGIKIPRQWQVDWQEPASLLLTVILVVMFFLEPIIMCLQHSEGVIFTQTCAEAKDLIPEYEILSMLALLTQFALIIDVAAISTRLSCWVLLAGHVFPEFVMTCAAIVFLMLTFSSSISASLENPEDFQDIVISSMSFFKLAVGMYPPSSFVALEDDLLVLAIVSCFRLLVVFFLFKLLIAQLNCEYRRIYRSMMGHARLCRMWKMCQAMLSIHPSRFQLFIERMCFDEPLDFSEGDQGIAGGIQILEPANLHPTHVDSIRRLGGDPKHPFPMEEEQDISEAARCRRLFELFQKQMKLTLEASVDSRGSADPGQEPGSRVSAFTGSLVSSMAPSTADS